MDLKKVAIFKALGDETRLKIVEYLLFEKQYACDFSELVKKDQSTVSRHLKILVDAGILKAEKEGRNISYKIKNNEMKKVLRKFGLKENNKCCLWSRRKC